MVEQSIVHDVLIVESTLSMAIMYQLNLEKNGIKSQFCQTGERALAELRTGNIHTVILDLRLPDMNGLDIILEMNKTAHEISFITITDNGSVNTAVEAMRAGADDFLIKPFPAEKLLTAVQNAIEKRCLKINDRKIETLSGTTRPPGFVGESAPMRAVYKMIQNVADSNATVFITGASGTGKEVTAQAIHKVSYRRKAPFIALNCAALPEHLIESEIFGHVKGAFTGAHEMRKGAISQAVGGTLFLDEICEMDINLQAKLLRFLQTGQVKRVGSDWTETVDVRIVCATNRDPVIEVNENRFREDLFYRLDVLSIELPPLSSRGLDVILLANSFLKSYAAEEGRKFVGISPAAKKVLLDYYWPGNVRELQNTIRKAVVIHDGIELEPDMLSFKPAPQSSDVDDYQLIGLVGERPKVTPLQSMKKTVPIDINQTMRRIEQHVIESVIAQCGGSVPKASLILDISPSTIYRKQRTWIKSDLEIQTYDSLVG